MYVEMQLLSPMPAPEEVVNVGTVCTRPAVCVSTSATLAEVAVLMKDEHVGAVIVTTGGNACPGVVGIITDRDIVRAQLAHVADLSRLDAGESMTGQPLVFEEREPIEGAIAHLRARRVRRAPVLGADGKVIGLVSIDDLLAHLATTLVCLARIGVQQVRTEQP
jgi:CBS domain-containing protein